jgi:hypothetical protein
VLRRISAVSVLLVLAISAVASAAHSPAALIAASIAAGDAEGSVHYVGHGLLGTTAITIKGDAALSQGRQVITFRKSGHTGQGTELVINNVIYLKADAVVLANFTHIPATMANKWLALRPGARDYESLADAIRLKSVMSKLRMSAPLSLVAGRTVGRTHTIGIRSTDPQGGFKTTETLYVRATGTPLPVETIYVQGSATNTIIFSRWKEQVRLHIPHAATPVR